MTRIVRYVFAEDEAPTEEAPTFCQDEDCAPTFPRPTVAASAMAAVLLVASCGFAEELPVAGAAAEIVFQTAGLTNTVNAPASWTVNNASGVADGDLLLMFLVFDGNPSSGGNLFSSSGWTARSNLNISAPDGQTLYLLWKIAGAGEPSTYSVSGNGTAAFTSDASCIIMRYSGVDATTPFDAADVTTSDTSSTSSPISASLTGITTATGGAKVVAFAATDWTSSRTAGSSTFSAWTAGFTEHVDGSSTTAWNFYGSADKTFPSAGASGSIAVTITGSGASGGYLAFVVALRPAAIVFVPEEDYGPRWTQVWHQPGQGYSAGGGNFTVAAVVEEESWQPPRPWAVAWLDRTFGQDDDLPVTAAAPVEEDFWTSGLPPVQARNRISLPFEPDVEEIPAATLVGQPDEDFPGPLPAPVQARNYVRLPLGDQDSEVPVLSGAPDLDEVWRNPVPPIPAAHRVPPRIWDLEELPAGSLFGQPDEDFWVSGVPPVPPRNFLLFPYAPDTEDVPVGFLFGVPEEDQFRPPPPWPLTTARAFLADDEAPQPEAPTFVDEEPWEQPHPQATPPLPVHAFVEADEPPAGTLFGCPDADEQWRNWVAPVPATLGRLYLPDPDGEIPAGALTGQPDEDFWVSGVKPVPPKNSIVVPFLYPYQPDVEELPAADFFGQPDEDFPGPLPAPVQARNYLRLPYLPDTDEDVPILRGVPEDSDTWNVPLGHAPPLPPRVFSDTDEWPTFTITEVVEDEPYFPPVARPSGSYQARPYLPDEDQDVPPLRGQPDEDYWRSGVAPVPPRNYIVLPYLPDTEDVPVLSGTPDADEQWRNWVAPVPASHGRLYLPDEDEDVPRLYGVPEEDQYRPPIPPPPPPPRPWMVDDEVQRFVVDDDQYRPPPPWVNIIVRPLVDTDEWPSPLYVEEDAYRSPTWPFVPPVRPSVDGEDWVPFIAVTPLEVVEDFYAAPRPWPVPYIVRSPLDVDDADAASLKEAIASNVVSYGRAFDRRNLFIGTPQPETPWDTDDGWV